MIKSMLDKLKLVMVLKEDLKNILEKKDIWQIRDLNFQIKKFMELIYRMLWQFTIKMYGKLKLLT